MVEERKTLSFLRRLKPYKVSVFPWANTIRLTKRKPRVTTPCLRASRRPVCSARRLAWCRRLIG